MDKCGVPGCNNVRRYKSANLCQTHYSQIYKKGHIVLKDDSEIKKARKYEKERAKEGFDTLSAAWLSRRLV